MRGFWKTEKELSDQAEISRVSSWAVGDLNLWISARLDNVKGGGGWWVETFGGLRFSYETFETFFWFFLTIKFTL